MSHLPLDARAILHYLNELGYRNISATQLKEFLKGMQPQSEINNKCKLKNQQQQLSPTTPTTRNTTTRTIASASTSILQQNRTTTATAATTAREVTKRSSAVKVVKCKKPLCHFKFYLDIRDHQLTKRIEEQIKLLGGALEFFLTPRVTHFVTDKEIVPPTIALTNNNTNNSHNLNISCPTTPQTPQTPQTPYSLECLADSAKTNNGLANKKPIRNSRADAILNRARRQSTINVSTPTTSRHPSKVAALEQTSYDTALKHKHDLSNNDTGTQQLIYVVWQCDIALRFFKKVQHELKDYLNQSNKLNSKAYAVEPISLKGGFIKLESLKRNFRPYYHLFKKPQEWPKIHLSREDGAFRLSPKKDLPLKEVEEVNNISQALDGAALVDNMTRKSRTKSSQNHNKLKNKGNDLIKSPANSQKQSAKCKNQTPHHQKDSSDKQCGVCEICKIEYDALTIHLKTKDHEYFAKNSQNFIALDSLIHSSADVNKFLDENRKLEIKTELEEMEVDHEGVMIIEQDPLQSSETEHENENQNDGDDDNDVEEDDDDDESQKSSSTNKRKSMEPKLFSPTLREKSKRSTKGKHSSEKFKNCTLTNIPKAPKTSSPQKPLAAFDLKTPLTKKKPSSTAAISPPIRAMLPPNSMYKVVESHTDVNCTPPRGKGLAAGLNNDSKVVGSPSIIVKFKKVRTTELQVLNGEAENFMFPKKRSDSSELPTDIDRQTTSDHLQHTQSSQQILTSCSSSEEQDPEENFDIKHKSPQLGHNSKKAITKAKRRISKVSSSLISKSTLGGEFKQSFPKTPIQPNEQLKSKTKPTTAITTKRKSEPASQNHIAKIQDVTALTTVSNKIVLPEATRKSSRTATAIVTAATTSTRLLQAAVEAAKNKHKLETLTKAKLPPPAPQYRTPKKLLIKQEPNNDSEQEEEDGNDDGIDVLDKLTCKSNKLRCSRKLVVKMEDRMGDTNKKPQSSLNKRKLIHGFDADDYEDDDDDDITIDGEDDDEKDEDFIVQLSKSRKKLSSLLTKTPSNNASSVGTVVQTTTPSLKSPKKKRSKQTTLQLNLSMREERLARRQSRLLTQLQLELQTGSEEEHIKELQKPKFVEKKIEKIEKNFEKSHSKTIIKLTKPETSPKKSPVKTTSFIKQDASPPSRYFDYTKSERLKSIQYAFERLPSSDLWYRVYKRQDNCEEKYFEYFGSTKYRKLPYELGPIPFNSTLLDHNKHKMCCKLCEDGRLKKESGKAQRLHVRRDFALNLKSEPSESYNNINSLESQEDHNCFSSGKDKHQQQKQNNTSNDQSQEHSILHCSSYPVETKSYAHKHKKLHLLQRYRQELEQQELLQRQKLEDKVKCQNGSRLVSGVSEIKTEDIMQDSLPSRNDRAGSTHSNASSCGSSTHTNCKSKKMRNRLLNKVSFLANLELPPRKSPREHASTLALVSCIIKQRQDSLSKPNSETDEPPTTPTETESKVLAMAAAQLSACEVLEKEPPKTPPPSEQPSERKRSVDSPVPNAVNSPRTRCQAATPIEELRFATEISETVKRMRRGRNKYDFSPPFVQRMVGRSSSARGRGRGGSNSVVNLFGSGHKVATSTSALGSFNPQRCHTPNTNLQAHTTGTAVTRGRRRRGRQKGYNNIPKNPENVLTSIRKTGSKKGVLDFDVDNIAIEALEKATTDYVNPKLLEWQIDKFLTFSNKEHENKLLSPLNVTTPTEDNVEEEGDANNDLQEHVKTENSVSAIDDIVLITPPATDYFSSDFDLCDIINQSSERLQEEGGGTSNIDRRLKKFSIFNTVHLNKYYRKRKNPKSNRTGWPKAPKKKAVTRQQSMQDKIYFLQNGEIREENCEKKITVRKKVIKANIAICEDETTQEQTRESAVITPPDSDIEIEDNEEENKTINEEDEDEESLLMEEDSQMGLNEDSQTANDDDEDDNDIEEEDDVEERERALEEDDETLAESVEDDEDKQREQKADSDADADIEEADEDEERNTRRNPVQKKCLDFNKKINKKSKKMIPKIVENDDEDSYEPQEKRPRGQQVSPVDKIRTSLLNPNSAHNSTPTIPFMRALRRTPQLNGSLGSCVSPSEKAGDNSDIFTVSSDGLDTDMDLSNSHSQLRSTTNVGIDEEEHHHHHHHHNISLHNNSRIATPKRKFDISKYAPTNAATCAAEAATAAVKSLAISQFLKKEVRVTCRRLRAPFRRFRYRR